MRRLLPNSLCCSAQCCQVSQCTDAPACTRGTPTGCGAGQVCVVRPTLDATGTLHIDNTGVTCALNLRSHHPALIDAGFADLQTPIPWWDGRTLRFRFPPR